MAEKNHFQSQLEEERRAIETRRSIAQRDNRVPVSPHNLTGVALSGGGVRSAAVSLGLLQSLYSKGILRFVDLLSTVSGGGYAGAFFSKKVVETSQKHGGTPVDWMPFEDTSSMGHAPHAVRLPIEPTETGEQPPDVIRLAKHGRMLRESIRFFNRHLIGVLLVNAFILSGIVTVAAALAYAIRTLDSPIMMARLNAAGFAGDLWRPLYPFALLSVFWFVSNLVTNALVLRSRTLNHRLRPICHLLFILMIASLVFGLASAYSTADLSAGGMFAGTNEKTDDVLAWITRIALFVIALGSVPLLSLTSLARSGTSNDKKQYFVFQFCGTVIVAGLPTLVFLGIVGEGIATNWPLPFPARDVISPIPGGTAPTSKKDKNGVPTQLVANKPYDARTQWSAPTLRTSFFFEPTISSGDDSRKDAKEFLNSIAKQKTSLCQEDQNLLNLKSAENCRIKDLIVKTGERIGTHPNPFVSLFQPLLQSQQYKNRVRCHELMQYYRSEFARCVNEKLRQTSSEFSDGDTLLKVFEKNQEASATAQDALAKIGGLLALLPKDNEEGEKEEPKKRPSSLTPEIEDLKSELAYNRWIVLHSYLPDLIEAPGTIHAIQSYSRDQNFRLRVLLWFGACWLVLGTFTSMNWTSLHGFYRDQLSRIWLQNDNSFMLSELDSHTRGGPLHIFAATVNFMGGVTDSDVEQKSLFTMSQLHCGTKSDFRDTEQYDRLTIGDAIAVSGAAVAVTNTGNMLFKVIAMMANLRLGMWLRNPRLTGPELYMPSFLRVIINQLFQPNQRSYLFVTDGGHIENSGIGPLLQRRCRVIIACDAGYDPDYKFQDLTRLVQAARWKHGVVIEPIKCRENPDHWLCDIVPHSSTGLSASKVVIARIKYPETASDPAQSGYLVFAKSSLDGSEPIDLRLASQSHEAFPHTPTSDQFVEPPVFEHYLKLGQTLGDAVCLELRTEEPEFNLHTWEPENSVSPKAFGESVQSAKDILSKIGDGLLEPSSRAAVQNLRWLQSECTQNEKREVAIFAFQIIRHDVDCRENDELKLKEESQLRFFEMIVEECGRGVAGVTRIRSQLEELKNRLRDGCLADVGSKGNGERRI